MRAILRLALAPETQAALEARQSAVLPKCRDATFSATKEWKMARNTKPLETVHMTLKQMMGDRERCMYCLDSHGNDIEHFWPKTPYPERMFVWRNLLLCCADCGRIKGDRFPLADGNPLLVDPTAENPWDYLDFDPLTGIIVSRFDLAANQFSRKGNETVTLLQLDRREALAAGYKKTYRRLARLVESALNQIPLVAAELICALREADDHGLLDWCFVAGGQNDKPFRDLRSRFPDVWNQCVETMQKA
jgi:uncharacterized protein (TIGR02646 family)